MTRRINIWPLMHSFWKNKGMWRKALSIQGAQGILWLRLSSVVAAASHFVCGRSQGCRLLHFWGRVESGKLYCFIRTLWESFVEASMSLSPFASCQQWIDITILWYLECDRNTPTKVWWFYSRSKSPWRNCSWYSSTSRLQIHQLIFGSSLECGKYKP